MYRLILICLCSLATLAVADSDFTLTSRDFGGQLGLDQVYKGFGCQGHNRSPELVWTNPPSGSKSFAVTVYDPDAPTGSGWWHWVVFNIPPNMRKLPADFGNPDREAAPKVVVQAVNDYGRQGFGGACPPVGDAPHRYIFTVYALDFSRLDLTPNTPPAQIGFHLNQHALAKASLIAYYGR